MVCFIRFPGISRIGVPSALRVGQDQAARTRPGASPCTSTTTFPSTSSSAWPRPSPPSRPGSAIRPSSSPPRAGPPPRSPRPSAAAYVRFQTRVARYNHGGPEALRERPHPGRPPRLAGPELDRFRQRLEAGPTPEDGICSFYGPDLRLILEREFGVSLGLQAVYDLLHRHGFSSLMPRPQHKDADEELQAIFKEVIADQIQAIREAHPDQEVRVWFEDEARFGQQGTLARVWARTGSRPRGVRQNQYTYLYVLTAVCVGTGAASGLIAPTLDVGVVNLFLEQFSRELPAGAHAVMVWDGAGPHTGGALVVPADVSLIQLVPYSPELKPGGEPLALPPQSLLVATRLPGLRGVGGGGDGGVAGGLPGPGTGTVDLRRPVRQCVRMKFLGSVL